MDWGGCCKRVDWCGCFKPITALAGKCFRLKSAHRGLKTDYSRPINMTGLLSILSLMQAIPHTPGKREKAKGFQILQFTVTVCIHAWQ